MKLKYKFLESDANSPSYTDSPLIPPVLNNHILLISPLRLPYDCNIMKNFILLEKLQIQKLLSKASQNGFLAFNCVMLSEQ